MRFPSPLMLVYGRIDGEMLIRSNPLYSFHGQIGAEIDRIGEPRVEGWVTNIGVVVCGDIADLHPGAGYKWGDPLPEIWIPDGCKPSHYWPNFNAAAAQSGELSFDVEKGEDSKSVKLSGQGGAPQVQVTSARGETISTVSGNFVNGNHLVLLRQPTAQPDLHRRQERTRRQVHGDDAQRLTGDLAARRDAQGLRQAGARIGHGQGPQAHASLQRASARA